MKMLLSFVLLVLLTACSGVNKKQSLQQVEQEQVTANRTETPSSLDALILENRGPAPELTNQVWLNTEHPLSIAKLRGKVVLLEMWTFG